MVTARFVAGLHDECGRQWACKIDHALLLSADAVGISWEREGSSCPSKMVAQRSSNDLHIGRCSPDCKPAAPAVACADNSHSIGGEAARLIFTQTRRVAL